jgi:hypothetical protein
MKSVALGRAVSAAGRLPFWLGFAPHRALLEAVKTRDAVEVLLTAAFNVALLAISGGIMAFGKKLATIDASDLIRQNDRILLYLRSFASDEDSVRSANVALASFQGSPLRFFITAEERLAALFGRIGPFVALGRPGERLPTLGAARLYVDGHDWRRTVDRLMRRSDMIVFRASHSSNFWDEVHLAATIAEPRRLLFWFPECRREEYELFCKRAHGVIPAVLPDSAKRPLFLYFEDDWQPRLIERRRSLWDVLTASVFDPGLPYGIEQFMRRSLAPFFEQNGAATPSSPLTINSFVLVGVLLLLLILNVGSTALREVHELTEEPKRSFDSVDEPGRGRPSAPPLP